MIDGWIELAPDQSIVSLRKYSILERGDDFAERFAVSDLDVAQRRRVGTLCYDNVPSRSKQRVGRGSVGNPAAFRSCVFLVHYWGFSASVKSVNCQLLAVRCGGL